MPTNANTFNSRVTSEALEAKFRQVFPAQGGAELVQDLYASGVIQPVVDFSSIAEGSVLSENLQTAWDFSTGHNTVKNTTSTLITNTGFWRVDCVVSVVVAAANYEFKVYIDSGITTKVVYEVNTNASGAQVGITGNQDAFVVFLRAGDSLKAASNSTDIVGDVVYRQIADVNGNLVNPLGFTFS